MVYETMRNPVDKICFMELTHHLGNDSQLCSCCLTTVLLGNAGGNQAHEMYKAWCAIEKMPSFALNYALLGFLRNYGVRSRSDSFLLPLN